MSYGFDDDRKYYPPISGNIFSILNNKYTNRDREYTAGLVIIPINSYKNINEEYQNLCKAVGMFDHFHSYFEKKLDLKEERRKTMVEFLKIFTIHVIPIKIRKALKIADNATFIVDPRYYKSISKNKYVNIETFYKLNEIFSDLNLKVPIYKLKFVMEILTEFKDDNMTRFFKKHYDNNLISKFIDNNKDKEIYTVLGANYKFSYINESTKDTVEIKTFIHEINNGCQDLMFLYKTIVPYEDYRIDLENFVKKNFKYVSLSDISEYKHLLSHIMKSIINNADKTKINELEKKLTWNLIFKIIDWYKLLCGLETKK